MRITLAFLLLLLVWFFVFSIQLFTIHYVPIGGSSFQAEESKGPPHLLVERRKNSSSSSTPFAVLEEPSTIIEDILDINVSHEHVFGNVHTFYYGWYGNPSTNENWLHWNHQILPDWRDKDPEAPFFFQPPDEIGANYYPLLGPYSSASHEVIEIHAKQMADSGIGNAVVSWYPINQSDEQLKSKPGYSDSLIKALLRIFPKYGVKVSIHIEPYEGRNARSVREDILYIVDTYSGPGLYLDKSNRPMIYIYDSYHTPAQEWAEIFSPQGKYSIRNTKYDCSAICLYLDKKDELMTVKGHFDGFYTYFGATGFTHGSTLSNWESMSQFAKENGKLFIPSVAPGYVDTRIRPWNRLNTRPRKDGEYYDTMWQSAIKSNPEYISITSFNEWHEGSQIEPAAPFSSSTFQYLDYQHHSPYYYLNATKKWALLFNNK